MKKQLALGSFVFSTQDGTAYEQLQRRSSGGWINVDLMGSKPRSHNTGQGPDDITISGQVYGGAGMDVLDDLRAMQAERVPKVLVDGLGRNLGRWKIMEISETQRRVIDDGTAMVIDFSISLQEYVDDAS
jgi:phage protein U